MTSYVGSNRKIISDEEENSVSLKKMDRLILLLLLLAVAFIPLFVGGYVKEVVSPQITTIDLLTSGAKGDMFTRFKMIALITISVIAVCILLVKIIFVGGQIRKTKLNYFLGLFTIAIVISTILSPSISISLWGQYNRSDGAISYICYLALFFVAMNIEYPPKVLHYVMYSLYPFVIINFILITMNFYGQDAMTFPVVEKMMTLFLPEGASLGENSILLGTLNQWNYMSGMFAVMTVMYLAWAIMDKNNIRSFVHVGVSVISFATMLMSISTSGFLTVSLIAPFLVWLAVKSTDRKKAIIAICTFIIISVPILHVLSEKNPRIWTESIGFVIKKNPYLNENAASRAPLVMEFSMGDSVYAADSTFSLPELPEPSNAALTSRVYIWEKAVEKTMQRPLFGYGLDTLMYHFPHYNIDARAGMETEDAIVDKPHSMFVGIFFGTGIVGFISFAGIALITVLAALKAIFKRKDAIAVVLGIAWLAFLIQAFVNDSLPGTAGPMWTLAGMMMACLLINQENIKNPTTDSKTS